MTARSMNICQRPDAVCPAVWIPAHRKWIRVNGFSSRLGSAFTTERARAAGAASSPWVLRLRARRRRRSSELRGRRQHAYLPPVAAASPELHPAVAEGEERVIAADADVGAWPDLGAALADEDAARGHPLARERLHAQTLALAVPAVAGRTHAFLVRHRDPPLTSGRSCRSGAGCSVDGDPASGGSVLSVCT